MHLNPLELLLLMLAVWRISYMLVHEDGLLDMFDHLRRVMNKTPLTGLFACLYCMSVWVALVFYVLISVFAPFWTIITILAVSAGAIVIERLTTKG